MPNASNKKSTLLLVAAILGALYTVYLVVYFTGAVGGAESSGESLGAAIAGTLVAPHGVCTALATIFCFLAWGVNSRPFALTSGILFAVAIVLFPPYFIFVTLQTIFAFVGFARLPKKSHE